MTIVALALFRAAKATTCHRGDRQENGCPLLVPNINDGSFAFGTKTGEISNSCWNSGNVAVQPTQFDSFGERLPKYEAQTRAPQSAVSRWMLRGGIGLFWSLVAVVLAARVIYFDPDLAAKFGQFAASLSAIFGA